MSHIWLSHVTRVNESRHTYAWVMSYVRTSDATNIHLTWVTSHIWMHHFTHINKLYHTHEWAMSHTWMINGAQRFDLHHTCWQSADVRLSTILIVNNSQKSTHSAKLLRKTTIELAIEKIYHLRQLWHLSCNTLQHTATHCNTLQHTATHCNTLQHTALTSWGSCGIQYLPCNTMQHTATQFNTLHLLCAAAVEANIYLASRCNTLQHIAMHCNTLHHTATHCNKHTATHCNTLQHTVPTSWGSCGSQYLPCNTMQHTATQCITLKHTALTRCGTCGSQHLTCNALQHTATHCNTL